jgi:hypothetical protein
MDKTASAVGGAVTPDEAQFDALTRLHNLGAGMVAVVAVSSARIVQGQ